MPYQRTGTAFLKSKQHALLADEMGLGKTIQAIAAINEVDAKKVLIVCPAGLKLNWQNELKIWLAKELKIYVVAKRSAVIPKDADIIIVNYDIISHSNIFYQLRDRTYCVVICDEAHYLKSIGTARTKAMLNSKGLIRQGKYKWLLTGTPVLNRPMELFAILRVLANDLITPYNTWARYAYKFCGAFHDEWGFNTRGASNLEELNRRLKPFMLRRLKKDVLQDLPDKVFQTIPLEVKGKLVHWVDMEKNQPQDVIDRYKLNAELGSMAEIRQGLALAKLEQCYEHIDEALRCQEKIVVFAHHRSVMDALLLRYRPYMPVCVRGGMTSGQKQDAVDAFTNNPRCRIFFGNIQAAGVGLNLQIASHVIFIEYSWVPGEIQQAVDRCHRIGQKNTVVAQFLIVKDTLDEVMMGSVINKLRNIKRILA